MITGTTSGIGKETARGLMQKGATVVFTTRDGPKGEKTKDEFIKSTGNNDVDVLRCDLASFDSVRRCCDEFKMKYDTLHVLINNAGIWDFKRRESEDGIERVFAVNYLAPFLMTHLLLEILKESSPSRIVNVASALHYGIIHFDDIEFKRNFSGIKTYMQSKLGLILFTRLLAKKLVGTGVTVNCVNPGFNATNLARDAGFLVRMFFKLFGKNPRKGAESLIYLASSQEIEDVTGEYFVHKKIRKSSRLSYDVDMTEKLWNVSETYVGLEKHFKLGLY